MIAFFYRHIQKRLGSWQLSQHTPRMENAAGVTRIEEPHDILKPAGRKQKQRFACGELGCGICGSHFTVVISRADNKQHESRPGLTLQSQQAGHGFVKAGCDRMAFYMPKTESFSSESP